MTKFCLYNLGHRKSP